MNRIFITGDIHGEHDIHKLSHKNWPEGKTLDKQDYVIIAGDFGLVFYPTTTSSEKYWLQWLSDRPWTTLFVDGNHENFDRLFSDEFPTIDMFGDEVKRIQQDIFYLQRGRVYTIGRRTAFAMGGAYSIDKNHRREFVSWWRQEEPSFTEWSAALERARAVTKVDYLIAHDTIPAVYDELDREGLLIIKAPSSTAEGLQQLANTLVYSYAFSGHFHVDKNYPEHSWRILFNDIQEIT